MNDQLAANIVASYAREANFAYAEWMAAEAEVERLRLAYFAARTALAQAEIDNNRRYNVWGAEA